MPGIVELVKKLGNPSFEREDEEVSNVIALCCSILPIAYRKWKELEIMDKPVSHRKSVQGSKLQGINKSH